jgi:AraC-like DNA-binding protein
MTQVPNRLPARPNVARGAGSSSRKVAPEPATGISDGIDPLSDVLQTVRLTGALLFLVDATSPWTAEAPPGSALAPVILPGAQHVISYHLITAGGCWCALPGAPPMRLDAGDVLVISHGDPYILSSGPKEYAASPLESILPGFAQLAAGVLPRLLVEGGGGSQSLQVACGFLGCDAFPFNPLVATLPRVIHMRRSEVAPGDRLSAFLQFALSESLERRAGSDSVLLRISELMFVEVVRWYLATSPAEQTGWLAGLRDPIVGRALGLLHKAPARAWTLEQLAREAGASRSTLAARFTHFLGQPPMQYLTRWRIQIAARLLADGATKVSAVALDVGYDSEAAFSRAFKKTVGTPPATWRSRHSCRVGAGGARRDR